MPKLFSVDRLLSFKPAPFGVCINKSILPCLISLRRCKGSAFICFLQAFSKINAYSLTFLITTMLIYAIL